MSLDPFELKRKMALGDKRAKKIYAIRKDGNLLLVTLLLGNMAVNSTIALYLGSFLSGIVAGLLATFLITIFGEIIPQALFSRIALEVGSRAAWLVRIVIIILFPICWPISAVLDKFLGDELPTIYSKQELVGILEEHRKNQTRVLEEDEERIARGALTFGDKVISDIMTPRSMIILLEKDDKIDPNLIQKLKNSGQSRFPVYDKSIDHIVGILYLHDLVGLTSVAKTVDQVCSKQIYFVNENKNLDEVLNAFIKTKHHLFIAINEFSEIVGIVSIEDILEEIIGSQIVDEFDRYDDLRAVAERKKKLNPTI